MPLPHNETVGSTESGATGDIAAVIVLAAGQGTRMKSRLPKVMHPLAGKPLVWHALAAAAGLDPRQLVVVLGHGRDDVTAFLTASTDLPPVMTAIQEVQHGTGHWSTLPVAGTGWVFV